MAKYKQFRYQSRLVSIPLILVTCEQQPGEPHQNGFNWGCRFAETGKALGYRKDIPFLDPNLQFYGKIGIVLKFRA